MEYASIGKGNAALTTGIIGTAGVGLGLLGNLLGMNGNAGCCSENTAVSRYELGQESKIADLQSQIALRDANVYNDQKMLEMYRYVDGKFAAVEQQLCAQGVVNAQVAANLSCMQNAINTLQGLTKIVIPIDNVCPAPMPALNSWTAPTTAAAG